MKNSPDELERLIHQTLRSLPDRKAPSSLEQRVLASIQARAAQPWWKQSFTHWPIAARCVFIVAGGALVKLALMATVWVMAGFNPADYAAAFSDQITWLENADRAMRALGEYCLLLVRSIPPLWLYAALGGLAATYAALFGIGAAAYRTLFANRDA